MKASEGEESEEYDLESQSNLDGVNYTDEIAMNLKEEETYLANYTFIHGLIPVSRRAENDSTLSHESEELICYSKLDSFHGIRIDTACNRSSVMSIGQYRIYYRIFHAPMKIDSSAGKFIRGIGGDSQTIGSSMTSIPFAGLSIIIDVDFHIMDENIPSLLPHKGIYENNLDINIQKRVITFWNREHPLRFKNYFLIQNWKPSEISYSIYTEKGLRR